jgi:hypothetical protein
MKIERQMVIAFAVIGIAGGVSIFTLPLRGSEPAPESGLTTEPCTLDLEVARVEEEIESRKAVLDSMLESAELVKEAKVVTETTETEQVTTGEPESETVEETTTEEETEAPESSDAVVEIFPLTDSMMAADLQAWTYAHCTEVGVDPYIVMAVCERESCCIANIMGDGGRAYGMMQIHTVWVRDKMAAHGYSDADMLMAQPNITIGVEILQGYIEQGHGIEWALMAYNGGPSMAGTPATQEYARWVIARADELRQ